MKVKYMVVKAHSIEELSCHVEMLCNEGTQDGPSWEAQGGMSVAYLSSPACIHFYQALIKWIPDKEDVPEINEALCAHVMEGRSLEEALDDE